MKNQRTRKCRRPAQFLVAAVAATACAAGLLWAAAGPPTVARRGMVVAAEADAADAGLEIIKKGGNAIDAAVAAAFAVCVLEPQAAGLGGGGQALVYSKKSGQLEALDFREAAPASVSAAMFLTEGKYDPQKASLGWSSAAVPGTVAGLCELQKKYGSLPLAKVIEPAIKLAGAGFAAGSDYLIAATEKLSLLQGTPETMAIFMPAGRPPQPAERIRQTDLAKTLGAIARAGAEGFYGGRVASAIASDAKKFGGAISEQDLAGYRPVWRAPLKSKYRNDYEIYVPPPPSAGVALAETLGLLDGFDLANLGFNSAPTIHFFAEASKLAFSDLNAYIADPTFGKTPAETLAGSGYATERRRGINREQATAAEEIGPGSLSVGGAERTAPEPGEPPLARGGGSVIVAVDANGDSVAIAIGVGALFGSGIVVGSTGVLLNNAMADFSRSGINALAPGKRPLAFAVPAMVFRKGQPMLAIGAAGGEASIAAAAHIISGVIDHGMDIAQALSAARTDQGAGGPIRLERFGTPSEVVVALEAMGHQTETAPYLGEAAGVIIDLWSRTYSGAGDPRSPGAKVSGY